MQPNAGMGPADDDDRADEGTSGNCSTIQKEFRENEENGTIMTMLITNY